MKKEVGIHFGALSSPLEEQLRDQGYFMDDVGFYQKLKDSLMLLYMHDIITDKERDGIMKRFVKLISKEVRKIK